MASSQKMWSSLTLDRVEAVWRPARQPRRRRTLGHFLQKCSETSNWLVMSSSQKMWSSLTLDSVQASAKDCRRRILCHFIQKMFRNLKLDVQIPDVVITNDFGHHSLIIGWRLYQGQPGSLAGVSQRLRAAQTRPLSPKMFRNIKLDAQTPDSYV